MSFFTVPVPVNGGDFDEYWYPEPAKCPCKLSKRISMVTDVTVVPPNGEDCVICLSPMEEDTVQTPCGHIFHQACLDRYLLVQSDHQECEKRKPRARCPVCRGSMRLPQAVEATSASGLRIEVTDVPPAGGFCHFDRRYRFISLGSFQKPGMYYVLTSNDDRRTPCYETMWTIDAAVPVTVYLNFRSEAHVSETGVSDWLRGDGWKRNKAMQSTVSEGIPNGPYAGPVYSRSCPPGKIKLKGSNTWEGVYFVFVEVKELLGTSLGRSQAAEQDNSEPAAQPTRRRHVHSSRAARERIASLLAVAGERAPESDPTIGTEATLPQLRSDQESAATGAMYSMADQDSAAAGALYSIALDILADEMNRSPAQAEAADEGPHRHEQQFVSTSEQNRLQNEQSGHRESTAAATPPAPATPPPPRPPHTPPVTPPTPIAQQPQRPWSWGQVPRMLVVPRFAPLAPRVASLARLAANVGTPRSAQATPQRQPPMPQRQPPMQFVASTAARLYRHGLRGSSSSRGCPPSPEGNGSSSAAEFSINPQRASATNSQGVHDSRTSTDAPMAQGVPASRRIAPMLRAAANSPPRQEQPVQVQTVEAPRQRRSRGLQMFRGLR